MNPIDFKVGDLITVTKPSNTSSIPFWNEDDNTNMNYLTEGVHVIHKVGTYIEVFDPRIRGSWSLKKDWCTLVTNTNVNRDSPYYNVILKSKQLSARFEHRKKGTEYAF
jgi:hypothetical protein